MALRAEKKLFLDAVVTNQLGKEDSGKGVGKRKVKKIAKSKISREESSDDSFIVKKKPSKSKKSELFSLLTFGAERVFTSKGKSVSDEDIDLILGLSKGKPKNQSKLDLDGMQNAASFNVRSGPLAITEFQGKHVKAMALKNKKPLELIAEEWAAFTKRPLPTAEIKDVGDNSFRNVDLKYKRFNGHESICHSCKQRGLLSLCEWCPRSYHHECLGLDSVPNGSFKCPQHKCEVCFRSAHEAGGMLFRCVSCPLCTCEDHSGFDYEPVDRCDVLETFGYKKSSSACYILCSNECIKKENERENESKKSPNNDKKDIWLQLPKAIQLRLEESYKSDDFCSLAETDGFLKRIKEIDPHSRLLQVTHQLLYDRAANSSTVWSRIGDWPGIGPEKSLDEAAEFYDKLNQEISSWRPYYVHLFAKLLGLWTKSKPKVIRGGASRGKLSQPKQRDVSAVDSDDGLVCYIAIFLTKPSIYRLYIHHDILRKDFDYNSSEKPHTFKLHRNRESQLEPSEEDVEEAEEDMRFGGNREEDLEENQERYRPVITLRRLEGNSFELLDIEERISSRLRPRKRKFDWRDESDSDDF